MSILESMEYKPLIHCITNPISMMQCANSVLGLGARPIMAEHPLEVSEITETADALLLNLGNISDSRMEAMKISFTKAMEKNIPVVVDAVGIACSELRREFLLKLLDKAKRDADIDYPASQMEEGFFLVIKGNYSEIMALYDVNYKSEGVDAKEGISTESICVAAKQLSEIYNAVILASGKTDVVVYGDKAVYVDNGCPELSQITGTGCMLGAICATLLAKKKDKDEVVRACALLGIAGEMAAGPQIGAGTFLIKLMDNISLMTDEIIDQKGVLEYQVITDKTE
ncbi:MAG: hydroxyethylthiazole kinase [Butyrivibrio sp.]|nr:hydroxyethylthiazole kinase [Butyrivibrio sp.]